MECGERQVEILAERMKGNMVVSIKEETWKEAEEDLKWAIAMKLSVAKNYKLAEFVAVMRKAWGIEDFQVMEISNSLMVTKLSSEVDVARVLDDGPWNFRGAAVLMVRWTKGCSPESMIFDKHQCWVQVHNLPFVLRKPTIARDFAELAGRVLKATETVVDAQKIKFLRFKIEVDTRKPIFGACFLKVDKNNYTWASIRYERMPNICQACGVFDHEGYDCARAKLAGTKAAWTKGADGTLLMVEPGEAVELDRLQAVREASVDSQVETSKQPPGPCVGDVRFDEFVEREAERSTRKGAKEKAGEGVSPMDPEGTANPLALYEPCAANALSFTKEDGRGKEKIGTSPFKLNDKTLQLEEIQIADEGGEGDWDMI